MKKAISFSAKGQSADIGTTKIHRMLPNRYARAIGPYVFLDHIGPNIIEKGSKEATGPHPHKGIATLTYVLNGEGEHFDSAGNYAKVYSGGIQWMKSGKGIVHDENMTADSNFNNDSVHAVQFWINLPSKHKTDAPEYIALQSAHVPLKDFGKDIGWLKVIIGQYEDLQTPIPTYSDHFLYHIKLKASAQLSLAFEDNNEVGALIIKNGINLNGEKFNEGEFIEFDRKSGEIEMTNNSNKETDLLIFGGESYDEPMVSKGPFVMNTEQEIVTAYREFMAGNYGEISYKAVE
ncbi:MAG: pirin family protein [Flavobacteriales bacterium]|nr:pirin family protein [Flavobacteriales bacterium]